MEECSDNRFELIAKAHAALLKGTNIEHSPNEMAVLDDILFRCWQMGWLDQLNIVRCRDCEYMKQRTAYDGSFNWFLCSHFKRPTRRDGFCAWGEKTRNLK